MIQVWFPTGFVYMYSIAFSQTMWIRYTKPIVSPGPLSTHHHVCVLEPGIGLHTVQRGTSFYAAT